ncbi:MAG: aminotransferase class III-fold pyridoxal phosphate-dependent enzyme [Ferrovum myxofaciens]
MNQVASWAKRSAAAVWHPCTQMQWLEEHPVHLIQSAQGAWLVEEQGRRVLDAISSWWVNLWGHGHPAIVAALKDQLDRLDHVMLAGLTHQSVVELSERLSASYGRNPGSLFLWVRWCFGHGNGPQDECPLLAPSGAAK